MVIYIILYLVLIALGVLVNVSIKYFQSALVISRKFMNYARLVI